MANWTKLSLVLDFATPSQNEILRWQRGSHWKYTGIKTLMRNVVRAQLPAPEKEPPARVQVVFTRHGSRTLDDDNLAAGMKGLRDALVHWGLARDDDAKHMECVYRQVKCKRVEEKTTVEIEVLDNG